MSAVIQSQQRMTTTEKKATLGLSLVFAFRMLGMFMVLPVMTIYGQNLEQATPALIGLAIGAYGYTQALLQIPLGIVSDRIGRMPIIFAGLLVFVFGSIVAACADSIWGVIIGRILQGMGAISAAVMALLSDLTREQHRTKAMAFLGMSIGASFALAMIMGPVITYYFGLHGLFWFIAMMAATGLCIMLWLVPRPNLQQTRRDCSVAKAVFLPTLKDINLFRLDFSIAAVHIVMMANFMMLPTILLNEIGLPKNQHWWVYLLAFIGSAFGMVPLIVYGEKQRQLKRVLLGCVLILLVCSLFFGLTHKLLWPMLLGIMVFFIAFNTIEAILPSMISKVAKAGAKGTAMGIFSTSQFLGAAIGASLGGILINFGGLSTVFIGTALVCVIWLMVIVNMKEPPYVTSLKLPIEMGTLQANNVANYLMKQQGITEALLVSEESALYVKFDKQQIKAEDIAQLVKEADQF